MRYVKPLVALIVIIIIGFALLNLDYLWKHIRYTFVKPGIEQRQSVKVGDPEVDEQVMLAPYSISIPSLGIEAPIIEPDAANETSFQRALINGVGHFPATAQPGQPGNVYLFGHSSDYPWSGGHYKTVFALLPQIKRGAKIYVSDSGGKVYAYEVYNQFVASKTDVHLLDQGDYKESLLTVQTSYPIGTALKRYIVQARLIVDEPK